MFKSLNGPAPSYLQNRFIPCHTEVAKLISSFLQKPRTDTATEVSFIAVSRSCLFTAKMKGRISSFSQFKRDINRLASVANKRQSLGTFSSDDEHVNVNYRKLENEP